MSVANIRIYGIVPYKANIYKPCHYVTSYLQNENQATK